MVLKNEFRELVSEVIPDGVSLEQVKVWFQDETRIGGYFINSTGKYQDEIYGNNKTIYHTGDAGYAGLPIGESQQGKSWD